MGEYKDLACQDVTPLPKNLTRGTSRSWNDSASVGKSRINLCWMMNVGIRETHAEHKKGTEEEAQKEKKREKKQKPKSNEGDWDSTYKDESKSYESDSDSDSHDSDAAKMKKRAKPMKKKKKRSRIVHTRREDLHKDCVGQAKRRLECLLKQSNNFSHFSEVKEDVTKFQPKVVSARRDDGLSTRRLALEASADVAEDVDVED
jgi:DNA-nicking Smr family endonuclease